MSERLGIIRRSVRSVVFRLLFAMCIAVIGLLAAAQMNWLDASIPIGDFTLRLPVFLLLFLFFLLRPIILIFDQCCEISEHHLRCSTGRCSLWRQDVNIPFEELRGVRVQQNILQRLLGVGNIYAWTHSGESPEVCLFGVSRPHETATLISARIDRAQIERKSH